MHEDGDCRHLIHRDLSLQNFVLDADPVMEDQAVDDPGRSMRFKNIIVDVIDYGLVQA
jgi:serine/threonine protein kinase